MPNHQIKNLAKVPLYSIVFICHVMHVECLHLVNNNIMIMWLVQARRKKTAKAKLNMQTKLVYTTIIIYYCGALHTVTVILEM